MITFKRGGKLIYNKWVYDRDKEEGHYDQVDVTEDLKWLSKREETIELDEDVTLYDIMLFVSREQEVLDLLLTNCFVKDYVAEFNKIKGAFAAKQTGLQLYDKDAIEYLELYWHVDLETDATTPEIWGLERPSLHGVGVELQEDYYDEFNPDYPSFTKGTRIPWAIGFTKLEEIIHVPVRLNEKFEIYNQFFQETAGTPRVPILSAVRKYDLIQVLTGIMWELSFYGSPEDKAKSKESLEATVDEFRKEINNEQDSTT